MLNFKSLYDSVVKAEAAWKEKAAEIHALTELGTDEAIEQALALQESLDIAEADYNKLNVFYQKVSRVNAPSSVAQLFVPASPTSATQSEEEKPKDVMTLKEYNDLHPKDRLAFAKAGGRIQN